MNIMLPAFLLTGMVNIQTQVDESKIYDGHFKVSSFINSGIELSKENIEIGNIRSMISDIQEDRKNIREVAVSIPDSNLERAIRSAIVKPSGDIYPSDMERLTVLSSSSGVEDLTGLEHAVNLTTLNVSGNKVRDLSPLQNLNNLVELNLYMNNITSLTPIRNLTNLETLKIGDNYIDITTNSVDREIIDNFIAGGTTVDTNHRQYFLKSNFNNEFTLTQGEVAQSNLVKKCSRSYDGAIYNGTTIYPSELEYTIDDENVISVNSNNELVAVGEGKTKVQVHYKNLRGGGATVEHIVTVDPYVYKPTINYDEDGYVSIIDNGNNVFAEDEIAFEEFENVDNLSFEFTNSNWSINNGVMKSETITHSQSTENEFVINATSNQKLVIKLRVSSENNYDWGRIYLNGAEVYKKSGNNTNFETVEFDLIEGENVIKFKYSKDSSGNSNEDAMIIDEIKTFVKKPLDVERIEYRIDDGEWMVYTGPFRVNKPGGSDFKIEARVIVTSGVYESGVAKLTSQVISAEDLAEKLVEVAEQTNDYTDIELARDAVNNLDESSKKDELQDRLNSIFDTSIALDKQTATANLDIYIKSENMLSLSLDTNSVSFEDYSGTELVEKLGAVNITINSTLPYDLNAYMPTEISNADGTNKMDLDILNIRESNEGAYKQFENTTDKIVLKQNCGKGNNINHSIDLKLDSNDTHKADVYKTVIRFEAEQK